MHLNLMEWYRGAKQPDAPVSTLSKGLVAVEPQQTARVRAVALSLMLMGAHTSVTRRKHEWYE
jgi:hypothetical protein